MAAPVNPVTVGRIAAVYGVKGWVRVQSFTEPEGNLLQYGPWWVCRDGHWQTLQADEQRATQKGLLCHLKGIDDRDEARELCQLDIAVEKSSLPMLESGEYYWYQLQGLCVYSRWRGETIELGTVHELLATGANDVLVVKGTEASIDDRERLIPYIDQVVLGIDLEQARMDVDWDPDF